ncbi:MAG: sigma-54-dependent Fis family transcriptional regulator [Proteobacteria bacterium]|nr:sigma-54-dependent Fis family transcriptional regulator [Pseudomonadota bacterium]
MAKILIVDDDPQLIELVSEILTSYDYSSEFITKPKFMFKILENEVFDLILMDYYMPEVDGVTLLKELKAHSLHKDIPVIMLTSEIDDQLLARCFDNGAEDFINKPISELILYSRIKSTLAKQSNLQKIQHQKEELEEMLQTVKKYSSELKLEIEAKDQALNLLKTTFDGMAEGVVTLDSHFHIKMVSAKATQILDVGEGEALDKPAASILGSAVAGPSGVLMEYVNGRTEASAIHTQLLCPSGAIIPIYLSISELDKSVSNARWLLFFRDRREEERLIREKASIGTFGNMISCDQKMKEIFQLIDNIALSNATVLIQGESGTGKELVAQEIHARSRRAQKPFNAVNCAAIPANLLESEFFGHEKGAFTGAHQTKKGRFELADGGSMLLDEVSEIPIELQGKLLRALQEQRFERVGGTKSIEVDVRIIASTNRDLWQMVQEQKFREDLYYRLDVVSIKLPPLRDRLQDVSLLITAFIERLNKSEQREVKNFSGNALQQLIHYTWPGNIRELYHVVEYAFAVSKGNQLHSAYLPEKLKKNTPYVVKENSIPVRSEKEMILRALEQTNFRKGKAAALLGISPNTLYRKRKKFGI